MSEIQVPAEPCTRRGVRGRACPCPVLLAVAGNPRGFLPGSCVIPGFCLCVRVAEVLPLRVPCSVPSSHLVRIPVILDLRAHSNPVRTQLNTSAETLIPSHVTFTDAWGQGSLYSFGGTRCAPRELPRWAVELRDIATNTAHSVGTCCNEVVLKHLNVSLFSTFLGFSVAELWDYGNVWGNTF